MITLKPITEENFIPAISMQVAGEQCGWVASATGILARGYVYRNQRSVVFGIYLERSMIGLALVYDLEEEPSCFHLCEFLIDQRFQGKGYGQAALGQILDFCRRDGKYGRVEVCVKRENAAAIHTYEKCGFRDSGYVDPEAPDSMCMVCDLTEVRNGD